MSLVLFKQGYLLSLNHKNNFSVISYDVHINRFVKIKQRVDIQVIFVADIQACLTLQYMKFEQSVIHTAWKVSKYGVIPVPYFPVFGLNTESKAPYSVWIQENADQK